MRQETNLRLRVVLAATLVAASCGGDGSRSVPTTTHANAPLPSAPVSSAAQGGPDLGIPTTGTGICTGKPTWRSNQSDISYCLLTSDLELIDGRCQLITADTPKPLRLTVGVVTGAAGAYVRQPTNYGNPSSDCGATGPENGSTLGSGGLSIENTNGVLSGVGVQAAVDFPANSERTVTFAFDTEAGYCGKIGTTAELRAPSGGVLSLAHFVFRYPQSCRTCESAGLSLTPKDRTTASDYFVTLAAAYSKSNPADKLTLSGDGVNQLIRGQGSFTEIQLPRDGQPRTFTVTLEQGDSTCQQTITVTPPRTCALVDPQLTNLKATAEDAATITYDVTANVPGAFTPVQPTVFTKTATDRTETIGFVSTELSCPASVSVPVPHVRTCADVNPQLSNLTYVSTDATTATFNVTASVPGAFTPTQPAIFTLGATSRSESVNFTSTELACAASANVTVPSCASVNPPAFTGSGSMSVETRQRTVFGLPITEARANVSASYNIAHYGSNAKVAILLRRPAFKTIVATANENVPCGTVHNGTLSYTSLWVLYPPGDLLVIGANAQYSLIVYTGNVLNPTILQEIALPKI